MSGFSAEWLALREPADHASRNRSVAGGLAGYFGNRDSVVVVDLGCGTGSNLRATSQLLPDRQSWTLVDYDLDLLAAARLAESLTPPLAAIIAAADEFKRATQDLPPGPITRR